MTRLVLVRHGETDWNRDGRYQGQADPPLNAAGREQARLLASRLQGLPIEAIYSSDLQRAAETAGLVAEALGLPVSVDARLREIRLGMWEGRLVEEIIREYPAEWQARQSDPLLSRAPEGESVEEVAARVYQAANEIAARHPQGQVLVCAHGISLATLRCRAQGIALSQVREWIPENCEPDEIEWPVS
jgi:probable phosphoglycerate mutase